MRSPVIVPCPVLCVGERKAAPARKSAFSCWIRLYRRDTQQSSEPEISPAERPRLPMLRILGGKSSGFQQAADATGARETKNCESHQRLPICKRTALAVRQRCRRLLEAPENQHHRPQPGSRRTTNHFRTGSRPARFRVDLQPNLLPRLPSFLVPTATPSSVYRIRQPVGGGHARRARRNCSSPQFQRQLRTNRHPRFRHPSSLWRRQRIPKRRSRDSSRLARNGAREPF